MKRRSTNVGGDNLIYDRSIRTSLDYSKLTLCPFAKIQQKQQIDNHNYVINEHLRKYVLFRLFFPQTITVG